MYREQIQEHLTEALVALERGPVSADKLPNKAQNIQRHLKRIFPTNNNYQRWRALVQLFPDKLMTFGNKIALKCEDEEEEASETVTLTHAEASSMLRMTFALCYSNIQGRTFRDKHITLLDTHHRAHFTTRHLIVGVSRATHGYYVHIPTAKEESKFMQQISKA